MRGFTTDQPKKSDKYLKKLEEELEKARIFRKAKQLKTEMKTASSNRKDIRPIVFLQAVVFLSLQRVL